MLLYVADAGENGLIFHFYYVSDNNYFPKKYLYPAIIKELKSCLKMF